MINPSKTVPDGILFRPVWHTALLFCGILGPLVFLFIYFTFGSISPDFDMLRQPVGRLELMDYGWIQSANFIVYGLFTCAFAMGLRAELHSGAYIALLPLLHVVIAASMVLLGLFIYEPAHTYFSIFSAGSIVASLLLFARRFKVSPQWKQWAAYTDLCAFGIIFLSLMYWYFNHNGNPYAAVFEHVIIAIRMVWLVAMIVKLLWGSTLAPQQ